MSRYGHETLYTRTTTDSTLACTEHANEGNEDGVITYWAIRRSWFARVNALCNLSRKKSREVAAHFRDDF